MMETQHNSKEFLHTPRTVLTYLLLAVVTGLVVMIMIWVIADNLGALEPERAAFIIGVIAFGGMFLYLVRHWFTLTRIEQFLNVDINQDGHIGEEETSRRDPQIIRIQLDEVKANGHIGTTKIFDLPIDSKEQLNTFATAVLNGAPISERYWTKDTHLFSSDGYRTFRDALRQRGLIELVNPNNKLHGFQLTDEGRTVMQKFVAARSPSPTPPMQAV